MQISLSARYPLTVPGRGWAVVRVRPVIERTWDLVDEQLVDAAREQAARWERYATTLSGLLDAGWSLQAHGGVLATREASVGEIAALVDLVAEHGIPVEWCVPDGDGRLFGVGGLVAGVPVPGDVFPGAALPALVDNGLTGAQRIVDTEPGLREAVSEELSASAAWWRDRPGQLSDHAGHGVVEALERAARDAAGGDVRAVVSGELRPEQVLGDAPSTRVAVVPVSAVVFSGLMDALREFPSAIHAPRDGLAGTLRARGVEVARDLGLGAD